MKLGVFHSAVQSAHYLKRNIEKITTKYYFFSMRGMLQILEFGYRFYLFYGNRVEIHLALNKKKLEEKEENKKLLEMLNCSVEPFDVCYLLFV